MAHRTFREKLDKLLPWSFLGVILSFVFGAIAVYMAIGYRPKPDLLIDVDQDTPVVALHEPLGDLQLLYRGADLLEAQQEVRLVTVSFRNEGRATIHPNYFDAKDPLALHIKNGQVTGSPEVINGSSVYLRTHVSLQLVETGTIRIEPFILEPGEWFQAKMLVLTPAGTSAGIEASGKIADLDELRAIRSADEPAAPPFLRRVFGGSAPVQVVRLGGYALVALIILLAVILVLIEAEDRLTVARRRRLVRHFSRSRPVAGNDPLLRLLDQYVTEGLPGLVPLLFLSQDKADSRAVLTHAQAGEPLQHEVRFFEHSGDGHGMIRLVDDDQLMTAAALAGATGLAVSTDEEHKVDPRLRQGLIAFLHHLRSEGKAEEHLRVESRPVSTNQDAYEVADPTGN